MAGTGILQPLAAAVPKSHPCLGSAHVQDGKALCRGSKSQCRGQGLIPGTFQFPCIRAGEGAGAAARPGTHSLGRFLELTPATSHTCMLLGSSQRAAKGTEMDTIPSLPAGDAGRGGTAGSRAGGMLRAQPHAVGTGTVAAARASTCPGLQLGALAAPLTFGQGGSRRASTALSPRDSRALKTQRCCLSSRAGLGLSRAAQRLHHSLLLPHAVSSPVHSTWPCQLCQWVWFRCFLRCPTWRGHSHTTAPHSTGAWGALVLPTSNPNLLDTEEHVCFCFSTFVHFPPEVCGSVSLSSFCELKELEKMVWKVKDILFSENEKCP